VQTTIDDALVKLMREVFEEAIRQAVSKIVIEARHSPYENKLTLTGHLRKEEEL